ncbi:homoserine O-acetyltransferase MetX [Cellulomonas carbonis]|uniref:Homoserine O-acetyltransferase n=1 Tax=Cellulomonas carbonis T26 TaxID=947969 RepID=A0A0A0BS11_9CELL|nr:homoserine O-acetyltransferase [Cellulomonas carbonis]KGM10462.1 homoserine acetyltransferase [Cellulomonas carbonis T26]GGC04853.1 homoserine O-acetyltransferase [Cellulomonas carbonis]
MQTDTAPAPTAPVAGRRAPVWAAGPAVPASAAWREGDPVGRRQFVDIGDLTLECGVTLPVRVAYETWGELSPSGDNAVLVLHALTGDSHVTGPAGPGHPTAGWWDSLVGPGRPIDTDRWFVVAPNVLGGCQGTTGPASTGPDGRPWGGRFPFVTTRDQVAAEIAVADALGIDSWALVVGASMGGMRVLEWAVTAPERVRALAAIATTAQSSGDQIAWAHPQLEAIRSDPGWNGGDYYDLPEGAGPHIGLGIARQIAHTTYRSPRELDVRFGRDAQDVEEPLGGGGRYAVQSYLDHHAGKLARRFDANSYLVLTESMLSHDVGRGRGGVEEALGTVTGRALVVAVDTDRLYLPEQSERMAAGLPGCDGMHLIRSDFGHDGFLIEAEQVGTLVRDFLG